MPSREHRLARGGLLLLLAQQPAAALVISQPLRSAAPLRAAPPVAMAAADLAPGDKVAIIGASGNVGRLVALRLASSFKVAAVSRDPSRVRSFLPDSVELCRADLTERAQLEAALADASAVVICSGTTAFPTKAWSKTGKDGVALPVLRALADSDWKWGGMLAALDEAGYNTPNNVDTVGTKAILSAWAAASRTRKRLVLLSSIGVDRRAQMPFPILNACGVLDAKAAAEESIRADAASGGYSYTIVRPGQLFGGPYDNNVYLGTLFQLDKDRPQDVQLARGDTLVGDTVRSTLAEVIATMLETGDARDVDFSCVNVDGEPPSADALRQRLAAM